MFFRKKVEKPQWEEVLLGSIKGWQCTRFNEFPNFKHLFTSKYNDFNLAKHAPTIFPEQSVNKNRETLCRSLDLKFEDLVILPLEHGDKVLILDDTLKGLEKADGIITQYTNIPIMITYADCVPIMLYVPEKKILALVHAGWRSTAKKIIEKTISKMLETYMIRPSQIVACIGPAIEQKHFEVDEDVANQLIKATESDDIVDRRFSKPRIDLKKANYIQLEKMGVREIFISDLGTGSHPSLYSHRMQGKRAGRQGLIACITS